MVHPIRHSQPGGTGGGPADRGTGGGPADRGTGSGPADRGTGSGQADRGSRSRAGQQWPGRSSEPAGPGGRPPARGPAPGPAGRGHLRLTGRGALLGMFAVFFLGMLTSVGLGWGWLAGPAFVAGSTAAARYTNPRDLLPVAVSPPLLFVCALVLARLLTAGGHMLASVAMGSLLTLAGTAPWLFAGVAVSLLIATVRGLPDCVRDLRRALHPDGGAGRSGYQARRARSSRATPQ